MYFTEMELKDLNKDFRIFEVGRSCGPALVNQFKENDVGCLTEISLYLKERQKIAYSLCELIQDLLDHYFSDLKDVILVYRGLQREYMLSDK